MTVQAPPRTIPAWVSSYNTRVRRSSLGSVFHPRPTEGSGADQGAEGARVASLLLDEKRVRARRRRPGAGAASPGPHRPSAAGPNAASTRRAPAPRRCRRCPRGTAPCRDRATPSRTRCARGPASAGSRCACSVGQRRLTAASRPTPACRRAAPPRARARCRRDAAVAQRARRLAELVLVRRVVQVHAERVRHVELTRPADSSAPAPGAGGAASWHDRSAVRDARARRRDARAAAPRDALRREVALVGHRARDQLLGGDARRTFHGGLNTRWRIWLLNTGVCHVGFADDHRHLQRGGAAVPDAQPVGC